jgi:LuxR family transcriptional regulator, maltose regulon positive regulatory protein
VIVTRWRTPIPLGRLRTQQRVVELTANDLAFGAADTYALLEEVFGVDVTPAAAAMLAERTEGWAAGLCVAGLSLQRADDPDRLAADISGEHRHVLDYFVESVVPTVDADLQQFLLETSILPALHPGLCDAVTMSDRSAVLLAEAEARGLFVSAVDVRGSEYRSHAMFRDALAHELVRRRGRRHVDMLHTRAADWWRRYGNPTAALPHLITAGQRADALDVVNATCWDARVQGLVETTRNWLDLFDDTELASRPTTALVRYLDFSIDRHDVERADWWIDAAREALGEPHDADPTTASRVLQVEALSWELRGDAGKALATARLAVDVTPRAAAEHRSAQGRLASGFLLNGQFIDAHRTAQHSRPELAAETTPSFDLIWLGIAALAAIHVDDFDEATRVVETATPLAERLSDGDSYRMALVALAHGILCAERGDPDAGATSIERSQELLGPRGLYRILAMCWQARISARRGLQDLARTQLHDLFTELATITDPGMVAGLAGDVSAEIGAAVPSASTAQQGLVEPLTERELEVLRCFVRDRSLANIARELYISVNTVKTHTRSIYRKLGVSSRADARHAARTRGLI